MIVAGFGFTSRATAASLRDALAKVIASENAPDCLATLDTKADAACIQKLHRETGLDLHPVDRQLARSMATPTTSAASAAAHGVGSVAEAVALAAAGPDAVMVAGRHISDDRQATCALAKGARS